MLAAVAAKTPNCKNAQNDQHQHVQDGVVGKSATMSSPITVCFVVVYVFHFVFYFEQPVLLLENDYKFKKRTEPPKNRTIKNTKKNNHREFNHRKNEDTNGTQQRHNNNHK